MKLTKNILNEHGIYNSYDIAKKLGNKIFVCYVPATNGRLNQHYAYWEYERFDEGKQFSKNFTVTCRENKPIVFETALNFIRDEFGLDITDKDPFGAYHPSGTLDKLKALIEGDK